MRALLIVVPVLLFIIIPQRIFALITTIGSCIILCNIKRVHLFSMSELSMQSLCSKVSGLF